MHPFLGACQEINWKTGRGLLDIRERSLLRIQLRLRLLDRSVHIGLRGLLVRDARNVLGTGCLRVSHEPLVIRLRSLLLVLRGRQVTAQLLHEHVHERHDPVALAVLLLVGVPGRRRRRRGGGGVISRALVQLGVPPLNDEPLPSDRIIRIFQTE